MPTSHGPMTLLLVPSPPLLGKTFTSLLHHPPISPPCLRCRKVVFLPLHRESRDLHAVTPVATSTSSHSYPYLAHSLHLSRIVMKLAFDLHSMHLMSQTLLKALHVLAPSILTAMLGEGDYFQSSLYRQDRWGSERLGSCSSVSCS